MRLFYFIILFTLYNTSFGQYTWIDKGAGEYEDLSIAVTVIDFITLNKPEKISQFFASTYNPSYDTIVNECEYISTNFKYRSGSICFCEREENEIWYERTYYNRSNETIGYLYQIFIKLIKTENGTKISSITFRNIDNVIPRDKEIFERHKSNMPFPPAPPAPQSLFKLY